MAHHHATSDEPLPPAIDRESFLLAATREWLSPGKVSEKVSGKVSENTSEKARNLQSYELNAHTAGTSLATSPLDLCPSTTASSFIVHLDTLPQVAEWLAELVITTFTQLTHPLPPLEGKAHSPKDKSSGRAFISSDTKRQRHHQCASPLEPLAAEPLAAEPLAAEPLAAFARVPPRIYLLLEGDVAAGKTTLVCALARALAKLSGEESDHLELESPTYAYHYTYEDLIRLSPKPKLERSKDHTSSREHATQEDSFPLHHYDLYRFHASSSQLSANILGVSDTLQEPGLHCIEWPSAQLHHLEGAWHLHIKTYHPQESDDDSDERIWSIKPSRRS